MKQYNQIIISLSGFDPSSGAGLLNDTKALNSIGVHCFSVPSCLTVQDYKTLYNVYNVDLDYIFTTLKMLFKNYKIQALKIGLFNNFEFLNKLSCFLSEHKISTVLLDPVIKSSSGFIVWDDAIIKEICERLLYQVDIITPNVEEFNKIYKRIYNQDIIDLKEAIIKMQRKYSLKIAVTGGDTVSNLIVNYYFDGLNFIDEKIEKKIVSNNIHGTGCAFSALVLGFYIKNNDFNSSCISASSIVSKAVKDHSLINSDIVLNYGALNEIIN